MCADFCPKPEHAGLLQGEFEAIIGHCYVRSIREAAGAAYLARREHRPQDANRYFTEAVALCRESGGESELARALTGLGQIERDLHNSDAALEHYEEALALYRVEGDSQKIAHTVRHVGDIHRDAKRPALAEACYAEALSLYRSHPQTSALDLANAIRGMAILKEQIGQSAQAKLLWEEARALYANVGVQEGVAECERRRPTGLISKRGY